MPAFKMAVGRQKGLIDKESVNKSSSADLQARESLRRRGCQAHERVEQTKEVLKYVKARERWD